MRRFFLLFPLLGVLVACAGLTPPVPGVPEAQYEKGLRFSEKEFSQPIDILKGEWNPADSNSKNPAPLLQQPEKSGGFRIQIISLGSQKQAQLFKKQMEKRYPHARFFVLRRGKYWAVQVGPFATRAAAARALQSIWRKKFPDAWIVHSR